MFYVKLDTFAMLFRLLFMFLILFSLLLSSVETLFDSLMAISRIGLGNVTYL